MPDRPPLTRDLIVRAATHLLDEAGAAEFSMRRLAAALGVDPMAVYRHLPGRAAILHEVLEAAVAELPLPASGSCWQERVRALCVAYRDLAHRHPGVFRLLYPYPRPIRSELVVREACFAALRDGGLAPADFQTAFKRLEDQSRQLEAAQVEAVAEPGGKKPCPPTSPAS